MLKHSIEWKDQAAEESIPPLFHLHKDWQTKNSAVYKFRVTRPVVKGERMRNWLLLVDQVGWQGTCFGGE